MHRAPTPPEHPKTADLVETYLEACLVSNRLVTKWVPSEQSDSDESFSEQSLTEDEDLYK